MSNKNKKLMDMVFTNIYNIIIENNFNDNKCEYIIKERENLRLIL